jgi:hypothetical protein
MGKKVYAIGEWGDPDNPYELLGFWTGRTPRTTLKGFLESRGEEVKYVRKKGEGDKDKGSFAFIVKGLGNEYVGEYDVDEVKVPGFRITASPLEQAVPS